MIKLRSAAILLMSLASATPFARAAAPAQPPVTEAQARAIALAKVPGGMLQSGELEREHGKLVWSFDIKDLNSANVIELQVDANTGRIVHKTIESPAGQAKESKADKAAPAQH
ncbi:MAG: PepSY domain-containing protein [Betaproteobacteria bacterium]